MSELINGFNRLGVSQTDCGDCPSCELNERRGFKEYRCQDPWCSKCKCRESRKRLKCKCTNSLLIQKFGHLEKKRVYGQFQCSSRRCNNRWTSAWAWIEYGQLVKQGCKKCNVKSEPIKITKLKYNPEYNDDEEKTDAAPHDQARCDMCKKLGRLCVDTNYDESSDEEYDDYGDYDEETEDEDYDDGNYHYERHNCFNQRTARNNETDHYYDYVHDYDDETDDPRDYLDDEYYLYNDSD